MERVRRVRLARGRARPQTRQPEGLAAGLLAVTVVLLTIVGLVAAVPAPASAGMPARASAPYVVAADVSGGRATMTLQWRGVPGAHHYHVRYARSAAMSDARLVSTTGERPRRTVGRLGPDRTWCFQVRAVSRDHRVGRFSSVHCKRTLPRRVDTRKPRVRVVTFNVCGAASSCQTPWSWSRRRAAIKSRVAGADADVVALQETLGRAGDLAGLLSPLGFSVAIGSQSDKEMLLYRRSTMAPSYRSDIDLGTQPDVGRLVLGSSVEDITAVWAKLVHRSSGRRVLLTSTHLSIGLTASDVRRRVAQTDQLIRAVRSARLAGSSPRTGTLIPAILAGDFNSSPSQPHGDAVAARIRSYRWADSFDRATTYSRPYLRSGTGYVRTPRTSVRYGDHIDRIFIPAAAGATGWRSVVSMSAGRYTAPMASDHNPIRVAVHLW